MGAEVWGKSKISMAADTKQFAGSSSIIKAMAHMPAPNFRSDARSVDPIRAVGVCDRDYGMLCPDRFVNIGRIKDGPEMYCTGSSDYTGPCDGAYAFQSMSTSAKARWSEMCLTSWPCKECTRDYRTPCPHGWEHTGGANCRPSSEYTGPCRMTMNFGSYNEEMREQWANQCNAFWDCLVDDSDRMYRNYDVSATSVAWRHEGSHKAVSLLASKSIPVDGYKIRNSLYLTQPMREPAQASVNVIMHEDAANMHEESKYSGREDQAVL